MHVRPIVLSNVIFSFVLIGSPSSPPSTEDCPGYAQITATEPTSSRQSTQAQEAASAMSATTTDNPGKLR